MKQVKYSPVLFVILLSALCGGVLPSFGGETLPTRCVLTDVPYVHQLRNFCGPAALTSVLSFWGLKTDQKTVGKAVYDSSLQATNGADMLLYARAKGFSAYSWNSSMSDLKSKLTQGIPVIVLQDSSLSDSSGHYRVATGYDDKSGVIYVNDPYEPDNKRISYSEFCKLWDRHGNWSLLVCPTDRDNFKKELDETNPVVHIDLAYIYYKHGDMDSSERESRLALSLEPANYSAKSLLAKATNSHGARSKDEKPKSD
jgi:predicted double-glycine peptidase